MQIHLKNLLTMIAIMSICLVMVGSLYNRDSIKAAGSDKNKIVIETETKELYTKESQLAVRIIASNKELINKDTYLSYHVYSKSGEELLYENVRLPIHLDKVGEMVLMVPLNLKDISNQAIADGAVIKFDIVDEKRAIWFSLDESVDLSASSITFENNYIKRICFELKKEVWNNPVIFLINLTLFLLVIIGYVLIKRKHLFDS